MLRKLWAPLVAALLAACTQASAPQHTAQPAPSVAAAMDAARAHMAAHEAEVVQELRDLLALPNVASNESDIRRNAVALVAMLERRGITARILETPGAPPSVYGELNAPTAERTLLFYAHFDGQPVGDESAWVTPPFEPTLRDGRLEDGGAIVPWRDATYPLPDEARIYARSASDDKSPIVAMLAALDAMSAAGIRRSANLKFFLEGEEEAGSPNLTEILTAHRDTLSADLWVFGDGPIDPRGLPRVTLGVRGVIGFDITVYGPAMSLHSGHYGNVAPNPGARLSRLIASMRADDGVITIEGFDRTADPVSPRARELAREAFDDAGMLAGPQLAATESGLSYGESVLRTSLNVQQLRYGGSGESRNAIDPEASASFDMRITPGVTLEEVRTLVEAHLRSEGYHLVADTPTQEERLAHPKLARIVWGDLGYQSAMAPLDHPGVNRVIDVMRVATNNEVRVAPLLGGSLPIAPIGDVLQTPFVIVPIVNADNNQHAPNENVRMREFRNGVAFYAALIAEGGNGW